MPDAGRVMQSGDLSPEKAWLLYDPSPEAQIAWMESLLTIDNEHGNFVDVKIYPQQREMVYSATGRDWTVKGRQTRASSLIHMRNLRRFVSSFGIKWVVATQDDQTTATFRARIKHHLKDLERATGDAYPLALDNSDELVIKGMENRILFASGNEAIMGRAYTGHIVHLSEIAHWPEENASKLLGDIIPAIPGAPHGWFDAESTPNGAEGTFHDWIMSGRPIDPNAGHMTHWYPWWMEPRYIAGSDPMKCDYYVPEDELARRLATFVPSREEEELMLTHSLVPERMLWRRYRMAELAKTSVPFLQEYPEDLDGCFLSVGGNYFASPDGYDHVAWYRKQVAIPLRTLESLKFRGGEVSFFGPNLSVWEFPQPAAAYVGYVDSAGGGLDEKSDFSILAVLDADTMRNVATLRLKCAPDELAPMVCAVMEWYNKGTLGGERDAYGSQVLSKIKELHYPNLWYYIDPSNPPKMDQSIDPWMAPNQIRDRLLSSFRGSVFTHRFISHDANLFREMGAFTWQKVRTRQSWKAAGKAQHDDLVIANAGCVFIAPSVARGTHARNEQEAKQMISVGAHGLITRIDVNEDAAQSWMR